MTSIHPYCARVRVENSVESEFQAGFPIGTRRIRTVVE